MPGLSPLRNRGAMFAQGASRRAGKVRDRILAAGGPLGLLDVALRRLRLPPGGSGAPAPVDQTPPVQPVPPSPADVAEPRPPAPLSPRADEPAPPPVDPDATVRELREIARERGIAGRSRMTKAQLIDALNDTR